MSLTIILAALALVGLLIVFVAAYLLKGWKIAFLSTGIAAIVFSILYILTIIIIVRVMQ